MNCALLSVKSPNKISAMPPCVIEFVCGLAQWENADLVLIENTDLVPIGKSVLGPDRKIWIGLRYCAFIIVQMRGWPWWLLLRLVPIPSVHGASGTSPKALNLAQTSHAVKAS